MAVPLIHDLRFAVRALRARPGLTAVIVATFALGIGASTAMFSLVDPVLLRPLPFERPERLAVLWGSFGPEREIRGASPVEIADWRAMNRSFEDIAVFDPISLNLRTAADPERVQAEWVTSPYFRVLGVQPVQGRGFLEEEDGGADAHPVVVVSHDFWQRRLDGAATAVGTVITLNDQAFTVVGIAPPAFRGLTFQADLWVPLSNISLNGRPGLLTERNNRWLGAVGRLRDGTPLVAAQADLDRVAATLAREYPGFNTDRGIRLMSLKENALDGSADLFVTLFGSVLLFLLIACANVASLQLVRATGRGREMALRLAIGARRSQIVRQLLTEGVVVAMLGGAAGVLLAQWTVSLLVPLVPAGLLPAHVQVGIDARVLGFSLGITLLCGIVCGLAPAVLSGRKDLGETLREGSRASSSGLGRIRRPGLQQVLVAGEVAIALVLLVGAGLIIRSLREQLTVAPGFAVDRVMAARVALPRQRYEPEQRNVFATRLLDRLREIPTVATASVSSDLPMRGVTNAGLIQTDPAGEWIRAYRHLVTPDFFEVLQIPILRGRAFTADDRAGAPMVAVISDAMARRFWPGQDPVGKRFQYNRDGVEVTIVGVAGDVRYRDVTTDLSTTDPDVFYPFAQRTDAIIEVAVRSRSGGPPPVAEVRRALASLDPLLPLYEIFPLETGLQSQFAASRFASLVLGAFSVVALMLAAIGIYGVLSFVVGLARREIAIRMALGADRQRVLGVVVRNGMTLVLVGAALGVLGALAVAPLLASQLYGVRAADPLTFAAVTATLVSVALLASWLPARRAAAVEPQSVLKEE
jgi:predicted permease